MSKKNRAERKEEERRIIAEMEEAMQETSAQEETTETKRKWSGGYEDITPQQIHCKRCKTLMENGVCPTCGFRIYVPMSKEKRDKIRLIVAGVCMGIFVVLFIISQIQKS